MGVSKPLLILPSCEFLAQRHSAVAAAITASILESFCIRTMIPTVYCGNLTRNSPVVRLPSKQPLLSLNLAAVTCRMSNQATHKAAVY